MSSINRSDAFASRQKEFQMEESLRKVMLWAGHGTPRQFYHELVARLSDQGYEGKIDI